MINSKYRWAIPAAVVGLLLLVLGGFFIFKNQIQTATNPVQGSQEEVKAIVAEVGKLIDLPANETPTIATITDITKLANQPFFQNAKNGDKVLIYNNAKKAIIYDPSSKKVIDVAPINVGTPSAQTAPSPSTTGSASPSSKLK
jgi:uncharacterized protein YneF (UPF0154 family)